MEDMRITIETLKRLPQRPDDGHKGTFGTVSVIGGHAGMHDDTQYAAMMLGAPALSAMGAIRAGCGLVKIAAPMPIMEAVLTLAPFATGFGLEVDEQRKIIASSAAVIVDELVRTSRVIVAGPGLGRGHEIDQTIVRLVGQEMTPVVLDADGINALAEICDFTNDVRCAMVLTPHPGEALRLMSALSIDGDPAGAQEQRIAACCALAQRIGCIVVLKGKETVVSDGHRYWICERGGSVLASGGTGDVLSGVIGSLIAQGTKDLFTASVFAVQAHAIAGEQWESKHRASGGLIACELADELPGVIDSMRSKETD